MPNEGGSATWTNETTLTGWWGFGGSPVAAYSDIYRIDGNTTQEGLHSLGTDTETDRALGGRQYSEQFMIGAHLVNDAGGDLTEVTISYTGEQWKAVAPAGNVGNYDLLFEYSLDATSGDDTSATWTSVTNLDFNLPVTDPSSTSALDGNDAANQESNFGTFDLTSAWADGDALYIRWSQAPDNSYRQGAYPAVDDLSFSAIPEPGSLALLGLGSLLLVLTRRR